MNSLSRGPRGVDAVATEASSIWLLTPDHSWRVLVGVSCGESQMDDSKNLHPRPVGDVGNSHHIPLVAIFNSMVDVIDMLRIVFEQNGFRTVTARLSDIQSGTLDLVTFVKEHQPAATVYDIPRPWEANRNFLRLLKDSGSMKRYTLDEVVAAVHSALAARGRHGVGG
jgi:hypothetical protein